MSSDDSAIHYRSAADLVAAIRDREISSRELLEVFLKRAESDGAAIHAIVTLDAERARDRADEADARVARGESLGPLHGLPITVKDCFETEGLRTTAGAPEYLDHVPAADADAVARLRAAGAVVFGKTNAPKLAMDWQTDNSVFGRTNNPWDLGCTPGGSSGGSAAAVAAGHSALELGSDIGGSIRIPAHNCGVFGHKPTWGIVPTRGHIPGPPGFLAETDLNVVGPLARSAADLALALDVLAGPARDRAAAWRLELPPPRRDDPREYRVAAWLDDPLCPPEPEVREVLEACVEALRGAGVAVDSEARPAVSLAHALDVYQRLFAPIAALTLSDEQFAAIAALARFPEGPAATLAFARGAAAPHRDWLRACDERERMRAAWADFFQRFDVLLCPVSPFPAIPHDASHPASERRIRSSRGTRPYMDQLPWMGAIGAAHLPATVAPAGRTPGGIPVGIQIVGPYLEDRTSIDFARRIVEPLRPFEPPGP